MGILRMAYYILCFIMIVPLYLGHRIPSIPSIHHQGPFSQLLNWPCLQCSVTLIEIVWRDLDLPRIWWRNPRRWCFGKSPAVLPHGTVGMGTRKSGDGDPKSRWKRINREESFGFWCKYMAGWKKHAGFLSSAKNYIPHLDRGPQFFCILRSYHIFIWAKSI